MYITTVLEYSAHLELAIIALEQQGVKRKEILAIPLDRKMKTPRPFDTIGHSDGRSLFDGAMILGTVFMVLGVIYGYVWEWGPILWGLLGFLAGALLGFLLDNWRYLLKGKQNNLNIKENNRVVLIIHCLENHTDFIENILLEHGALGTGRYESREQANS